MVHDKTPAPLHQGSCLCGAIRYQARADIKAASHCHCGMCRKAHGAAFGSYGNVPVGSFAFTQGADMVRHRESSPGVTRSFCPDCGSPFTWHSEHGDAAAWISFSLGTLDTPFVPRKALRDIHADSTPAWHGSSEAQGRRAIAADREVQPMNFQIRRANAADAPGVGRLTRAAYAKWVPVIGREPLPMKADHEAAVTQHWVDLLEAGGVLAGLIEMVPEPPWLLIENLAVAPAFQGRGCARILLEQARKTALAHQLQGLRLYTNKQFESNVGLYLHHGFSVDREEPFLGGFTVYMSKSLGA